MWPTVNADTIGVQGCFSHSFHILGTKFLGYLMRFSWHCHEYVGPPLSCKKKILKTLKPDQVKTNFSKRLRCCWKLFGCCVVTAVDQVKINQPQRIGCGCSYSAASLLLRYVGEIISLTFAKPKFYQQTSAKLSGKVKRNILTGNMVEWHLREIAGIFLTLEISPWLATALPPDG